jgi:hypothetical protein
MTTPDIIINVVEQPVEFDLAELAFDLYADTQKVIFAKVPATLEELGVVVGHECSQLDGEVAYPHCDGVEKREHTFSLGTARPWTIDLGDRKLSVRVVLRDERARAKINNAKGIGAASDNEIVTHTADDAEKRIKTTHEQLVLQSYGGKLPERPAEAAAVVVALSSNDAPSDAPEDVPVRASDGRDTLSIISGPSRDHTLAQSNRARLGLMPHSEAFEKFIADQQRDSRDLKRRMIGCAVTPYNPYADLYADIY